MPPASQNTENIQDAQILSAGPFVVDLDRMRLTRGGAPIALSALPLRILAILIAAPGKVATRAALKHALWPEAARIDTERRLNTAVRALREALDDTAEAPSFIETVRGRGYRWIGAERAAAAPTHRRRQAAAAVLVTIAVFAFFGVTTRAPDVTPEQRERFLQIAATADAAPGAAVSALSGLLAEQPRYRPAQVLRATIAVRRWREAANATALRGARSAVSAAQASVGADADLETLAGELALNGAWDWRAAERHYRRALALDANHVGARKGLAWLLLNAGRDSEAFAELAPVLGRADLTDGLRAELGWLLLRMRRADLAAEICTVNGSTHINLLTCRHTAFAQLGRAAEARDAALTLMQRVGAQPAAIRAVREAVASEGYQRFLLWRTQEFLPAGSSSFQQAQLQAEAGQFDAALASLNHAYAAREPAMVKLWSTPEFETLRLSPRFMALWRAVGPR